VSCHNWLSIAVVFCLYFFPFPHIYGQQSSSLPSATLDSSTRPSTIQITALPSDPISQALAQPVAQHNLISSEPKKYPIGSPEMIAWLKQLIRDNLPPTYEDTRKWNLQREVWNGVHVKLDNGKLHTHRKKKLVNAGTWTRYTVNFVEPDKNLAIEFQRLEQIESGKIAFKTTVVAPLEILGQLAEWARDVKLFSVSVQATSTVRLTLEGTVQFQLNMLKLPPDIAIKPVVERADVQVLDFEVHRVSKVGGDFAELLGRGMQRVVEERVEDMNEKLVTKINTKLAKSSDKLSFSMQDWLLSKLPLPASPDSSSESSAALNTSTGR
jgi:hypothetical protein